MGYECSLCKRSIQLIDDVEYMLEGVIPDPVKYICPFCRTKIRPYFVRLSPKDFVSSVPLVLAPLSAADEKSASGPLGKLPPIPAGRHSIVAPSPPAEPALPLLIPPDGTKPSGRPCTVNIEINYVNFNGCVDPFLASANNITVGDLHANALTLFIILVKCGAIILPKDPNVAKQVWNTVRDCIVRASFLNSLSSDPNDMRIMASDYYNFVKMLDLCEINRTARRVTIRLLGDVLADRLSNDALMIELLFRLISTDYPIIIIYSNHDHEFMLYLASPGYIEYNIAQPEIFLASLLKFQRFMNNAFLRKKYKEKMPAKISAYISKVRMFDYTWHMNGIFPHQLDFCLYSHAAFDFKRFEQCIAILLNVQHIAPVIRAKQLMELIDIGNIQLRKLLNSVLSNRYGDNPTDAERSAVEKFKEVFAPSSPPLIALWYRGSASEDIRPSFANFYNTHGHDLQNQFPWDKSYDQEVGKIADHLTSTTAYSLAIEVVVH